MSELTISQVLTAHSVVDALIILAMTGWLDPDWRHEITNNVRSYLVLGALGVVVTGAWFGVKYAYHAHGDALRSSASLSLALFVVVGVVVGGAIGVSAWSFWRRAFISTQSAASPSAPAGKPIASELASVFTRKYVEPMHGIAVQTLQAIRTNDQIDAVYRQGILDEVASAHGRLMQGVNDPSSGSVDSDLDSYCGSYWKVVAAINVLGQKHGLSSISKKSIGYWLDRHNEFIAALRDLSAQTPMTQLRNQGANALSVDAAFVTKYLRESK